ncbi:hypothetical protein [Legionella sp.]|uniref:hypothetical protein n=1 Tax=Legionella sp. TaxID=459 RepID=UPI003220998B
MAKFSHLADVFLKLLLLVITVSVFVPFSPKMPAPGLDSSWALGLNQAIAQGLAFGKDILFTLGPYSAIYTKAYHPSTDFMTMGGSLYLAISYWICLILLMRGIQWHWSIVFGLLLFTMVYVRDSLFFSYPLLAGLVCFKMVSFEKGMTTLSSSFQRPAMNRKKLLPISNQHFPLSLILIFAPFGLLPLIKGSLLILCTVIMIFCAVFFKMNKKNQCALISLGIPLLSLLLFWVGAGQSLSNLFSYLSGTVLLASGFSEAMSTEGSHAEITLYLINSTLLLSFIATRTQIPHAQRFFLLSLFLVFLFLSFKTGFTRHVGHAFIASSSILIAALLLPFLFHSKMVFIVILISFYTWKDINSHYTQVSIRNNFKSTYTAAWFGLKNRLKDRNGLIQDFNLVMNFMRDRALFPSLPGTTDIYSTNQSYLISSGNTWSPRPVFQSYSVFTANLAEKNRIHLLGKKRPDNIIFKIEPIDERVPALEDGLSWPFLMANYQPVSMTNGFLVLQKKNALITNPMTVITNENHFLGETVTLPSGNQPLFAEFEIKPTILGQLSTILFKPTPLQIHFELKDGTKKQYRFIATMAKAGFLLSPLVENTAEFALLFNKRSELNTKLVKSFQISLDSKQYWQWNNEYLIRYKHIANNSPPS